MITVLTWIWRGERIYLPEHVNVMRSMFARHLHVEHRVVCITDETEGFDPRVIVMRTPDAARVLAEVKTPEGARMPSCYRRLWLFSEEARCLGERVLLTDVDLVLTGDITHLVRREESFVGWLPRTSWGNPNRVAGGLYLMTPGAHPEVWGEFGHEGIAAARAAGYRGSDQAWLSYMLGGRVALWPQNSGIYAMSDLMRGRHPPPSDACMVQFAGHDKPWHCIAKPGMRWVAEHYR